MSVTVTIPEMETERLVLRGPKASDFEAFAAFLGSERSRFVGGPKPRIEAMRSLGHAAGLWVLRGYSSLVMTLKGSDAPLGIAGPWYPLLWPEPEFGWTLWDASAEGKGYVTEAMRRLMPWTWDTLGLKTAISVIDEDNLRSRRVAERLGAAIDAGATAAANTEGSPFHDPGARPALIYRHRAPGAA